MTKSGSQYNHMTTSVGYASSSDGPVHFGLGQRSIADLVEIHWPSGIIQTLRNVSANQMLKVDGAGADRPITLPTPELKPSHTAYS